ncbi:hypothetical protein IE3_03159, partial [Bacillus cereus BAG3X2-1]
GPETPVGPVSPVGPETPVGPVSPVGPVGNVNGGTGGNVGPIEPGSSAAPNKISDEFNSFSLDMHSPPEISILIQ